MCVCVCVFVSVCVCNLVNDYLLRCITGSLVLPTPH